MAKVALNFEDGVTKFIETNPYETISDAAYRQRINIPLDCADGACGTCKCRVRSGDYDPGDYIEEALTDEEADKGYGLACQMVPRSEMVVEILASSAVCKVGATTYQTTIATLEYLSSEIVKLAVKINGDNTISFLPGQYANILVPGTDQTRSYSFSSASGTNSMEFLIKVLPDGVMSNYLKHTAKVGDALEITGPLGSFYSRKIDKPTLLLAGGTGIAPLLAMLNKFSTDDVQPVPFKLFYGANTTENLVELETIEVLKSKLNLEVFTCVVSGETPQHKKGYVTQWLNRDCLAESSYDIYICGPNAMIESVKEALKNERVPFANFYQEKFLPSGS